MPTDPKLEIVLSAKDISQQAFTQFQGRIDKLNVKGLVDDLGGLTGILGKLALPTGFIAGFKELWETGTAFSAESRKFVKIFTDEGGDAKNILADLAKGFNITTTEAMKSLTTSKIFIENLGIIPGKARDISVAVVKLSADIAKFYGASQEEVMGGIESAMAGRYRGLKEYGIVLTDTMVANKAVAMGLARTTDEVTQGQKAFAALTLILEKSSNTLGIFAATAETAKGRLDAWKTWVKDAGEILSVYFIARLEGAIANIEKLKAAVGEQLGPKGQLDAAKEVLDRFGKTTGPMNAAGMFLPGAPDSAAVQETKRNLDELSYHYRELESSTDWTTDQKWKQIKLPTMKAADFEVDPEALKKAYQEAYGHIDWSYMWKNDPLDLARKKSEKAGGYMDYLKEDYLNTSKNYQKMEQVIGADILKEDEQLRDLRIKAWKDEHDQYYELSKHTAEAIQDAWSEFFFDAFTGKLKTLYDYLNSFYQSIAKMASQYLSQKLMSGLMDMVVGKYGTPITFGDRWGAMNEPQYAIAPGGTSANGNVFTPDGLMPFARGGIVRRPTVFPFARGTGLMGEAGPEAIMPLARNSRGELGVKGGDSGTIVNVNNYSGQPVQTRESGGGLDKRVIEVMIGNAITKGGPASKAFESTYGLKRSGR